MTIPEYDLVVIGSGPAGQQAVIGAAKRRKTVAVVDYWSMIGGVCVSLPVRGELEEHS